MRGEWNSPHGAAVLDITMAESKNPSTIHVRFDFPADLAGWKVVGWRVGTLEELKIARPLIWELCRATNDAAQLAIHRAYWQATTSVDWDGNPQATPSPGDAQTPAAA